MAPSVWQKGDSLMFDVFEAFYQKDFRKKISLIMRQYYKNLIELYGVGNKDKKGYPLLRGEAVDFILRNIIKYEERLFSIDEEWYVDKDIPADFVMYRCIKTDILDIDKSFAYKKIKKTNKFVINLMKEFFPMYDKKRHLLNITREKYFQRVVMVDYSLSIGLKIERYNFLGGDILKKIIRKILRMYFYRIKNR